MRPPYTMMSVPYASIPRYRGESIWKERKDFSKSMQPYVPLHIVEADHRNLMLYDFVPSLDSAQFRVIQHQP